MPEIPIDDSRLNEVIDALRVRFPESLLDISYEKEELRLFVKSEDLVALLTLLKFDLDFSALVDIVALDRLESRNEEEKRFRLLYQICNVRGRVRLHLVIDVGEDEPAPSVVAIYKSANWAEREIFDMFGIVFEGHPALARIYLPEEFEGYPLRKDFPLEGKEGGI